MPKKRWIPLTEKGKMKMEKGGVKDVPCLRGRARGPSRKQVKHEKELGRLKKAFWPGRAKQGRGSFSGNDDEEKRTRPSSRLYRLKRGQRLGRNPLVIWWRKGDACAWQEKELRKRR